MYTLVNKPSNIHDRNQVIYNSSSPDLAKGLLTNATNNCLYTIVNPSLIPLIPLSRVCNGSCCLLLA